DMAVITANGIVGKVLRVYASTSLVLMINDQTSGVGAMLEKSRLQGVLRGTPNGEVILERVMSDEQVTPGDNVMSSGGDQIFPKGLPVGTVSKVSPGREMFLNIQIRPAADLSRLEEVLVVTGKQEQQAVADATTPRVRAADILAQRLPSVPDRPAGHAVVTTPAENGASGAAEAGQTELELILKLKRETSGATSRKCGGHRSWQRPGCATGRDGWSGFGSRDSEKAGSENSFGGAGRGRRHGGQRGKRLECRCVAGRFCGEAGLCEACQFSISSSRHRRGRSSLACPSLTPPGSRLRFTGSAGR